MMPPGGQMGGMMPPGGQMGGMMPPGGFPGANRGSGATPSTSFLTINPELKHVLDALEFKKRTLSYACDQNGFRAMRLNLLRDAKKLKEKFGGDDDDFEDLRFDVGDLTPTTGVALGEFSSERLLGSVAVELGSEVASLAANGLRTEAAKLLPTLKQRYKVNIQLVGGSGGSGNMMGGPPGGFQMMGGPPGGFQMMGGPPGGFQMMGGPPGGFQMMGGPPGGGGFRPPGGGEQGRQAGGFQPPGGGFQPPGGGGGFQPPGGGMMPPGGFNQQGGPPGFGPMGGQGGQIDPDASKLDIQANKGTLSVSLDLNLSTSIPDALRRLIDSAAKDVLVMGAIQARSKAAVVYHTSHRSALASALKQYVNEKRAFPRGTADRRPAGNRRTLPYPPSKRLAWTAELLTYFGAPYANLPKDATQSWDEGANERIAQIAIPHLLAPNEPEGAYPPSSAFDETNKTGEPLAVTHFVGMAGLGMDAAEYQPGNPATDKKLGVFGNDRITRVEDIKDGLDKTIAIIQVPPTFKGCWLAGGGSTIRGVLEDDPVAPFVCTEYKGQKGTFAIMCDGKVRFIPASIPPETFKALCTIAGGEPIDNLDALCPEVKEEAVLKPRPDLPKPPDGGNGGGVNQGKLSEFQGTWKTEQVIGDGKKQDEAFQLSVSGDRVTLTDVERGGEKAKYTLKVDPTKSPKWIDLTTNQDGLESIVGIYEVDGDTWRICSGEKGTLKRPKAFSAEAGTEQTLIVLKRIKK
jgi:uncharacterized protein (TIGR03067 family)